MRATQQLSCHLGLDNVGQLTDSQFRPLSLGDLYQASTEESDLPDNLQLYSVAEKLIGWWKGLLQTDALTIPEAFKMRMAEYISLAMGVLNHPCQKVAFTLNTPAFYPRFLQVKFWDVKDPTHALYLSLRYPDEELIAQLKEEGKLWYPNWKNQLVFKNMGGVEYNGVVVCRTDGRWASFDATVIPDSAK